MFFSVNNMVKFMMRKGIVTDLARIPHSLDLSSPKMAGTVNAALKPLETLSRIMSQPTGSATIAKGKPKTPTVVGNEKTGKWFPTIASFVQIIKEQVQNCRSQLSNLRQNVLFYISIIIE